MTKKEKLLLESQGFTVDGDILIPKYDEDSVPILPSSWYEDDYYDSLTEEVLYGKV